VPLIVEFRASPSVVTFFKFISVLVLVNGFGVTPDEACGMIGLPFHVTLLVDFTS